MPAEPPGSEIEFPPEQVAALVRAIDKARRRQRIMIAGYALALLALVGGLIAAAIIYPLLPQETFRGWVFLAPLGLCGSILWFFGWLARKL